MNLFDDPRSSEEVIEVIDEHGVSTLQGGVDDPQARDAAEAIAARQAGVISVINLLRINL